MPAIGPDAILQFTKAAVTREVVASSFTVHAPSCNRAASFRFGADEVIDLEETCDPKTRLEAVRSLTGGFGADVVLECAGVPQAVAEGWELCRDGGKYLLLGHYCDAGPIALNPHVVTRKQLQVFGSWSSEPRHMAAALKFLSQYPGAYPFASLVTHRLPLDQADEALRLVGRWEAGKCVLIPTAVR